MLGLSSAENGEDVNLGSVATATTEDGGVTHGAALQRFADAIHNQDPELSSARTAVVEAAGSAAMVDAAAVCANFQMSSRIADGTGTPLDAASVDLSTDVRNQLDLDGWTSRRLEHGS